MMAETVDEFMLAMKDETAVEYVEITPDMLMTMAAQQAMDSPSDSDDVDAAMQKLKEIEHIEILSGYYPSDAVALKHRLAALTVDGLEEMVSSNDKGELSRVWLQTDGQVCSLIVVVNADDADRDWQVVKLRCHIIMDENFQLDDLIHFD